MASYSKPRIVEERSPWADFLVSAPDTVMAFMQLQNEMAWQANQAELSREFQRENAQLGITADEYRSLRERKFALEDSLTGYKLPYEMTGAGSKMIDGTLEGYEQSIQGTAEEISQLQASINTIASAAKFAKTQADQFGGLIKASSEEAWKDKMLEGNITLDADGNVVGTGEMELWLKEQSPETIDLLKDANYRQSLLENLRTAEESMILQKSEEDLETLFLQQEAARGAIINQDREAFFQINDQFEKQIGDIYKNLNLTFTSGFSYGGYKLPDLIALGASDPDQLMDIKEEYAEAYPGIAHDAETLLSGLQTAQAMGIDPSRFVVNFYSDAYQDFLTLEEFNDELIASGNKLGDLPRNNPTRLEIERLDRKVRGFSKLGVYKAEEQGLNHMFAVRQMYNEQQALRLTADVEDYTRVADKGLGLDEMPAYYPDEYKHMTPEKKNELEKSLAYLSAGKGSKAKPWDPAMGPNYSDYQPSKAELDVFDALPEEPDKDYWEGPMDYMGDQLFGERFEHAFMEPDSLRSTYKDPNAPASLSSQIGASLDELQKLNQDDGKDYLARVFVNSNFLKSTGIPFNDILDQWVAAGRPDPGDWLLEMFSDDENPDAGIEKELIR